jgi:diguanylate cyclase (GGDEF)-like protein
VISTEATAPEGRRKRARSLVTELLSAQLAITAFVGAIALVGLAWTSGSVIRNNLAHWAAQWAAELDELGAPFYLRTQDDAILGVERFVAKFPEIERVTWYRPDGTALAALDASGVLPSGGMPLDAAIVAELADRGTSDAPHFLTREVQAGRRFSLAGPIWTESLTEDGLFEFDASRTDTSVELLGFVRVDLDFSAYHAAFRPRLAVASAVLLALLAAAWWGGRWLLKRTLAPLSALQDPLREVAAGKKELALPHSDHREIRAIVSVLGDTVRSLQKRERYLQHLADHDPLTGLFNRHRFIAELEAEIERCADRQRNSALLFVDLDQFKYVNDTCGHAAGDQLLLTAARQIRCAVRAGDVVARFGGDEFVVLLTNVTRWEAKVIAAQVLDLMRSVSHAEQDHVFHLQCSIGIAAIGNGRCNAKELLARADIACRSAKSHGRNRAELYSVASRQSEQMESDVRWMRRIRDALGADAFVLHYQPLLHIASGDVSTYEALLRLETDKGLIGPQAFLPAAVRFGLMADIDLWVLESAVRALAEHGASDPRLRLSVNLSGFAFEQDGLAARVRALLREHSVAGDRLVLEVTEQVALRFAANTDRQITMLRDLGCGLAIDDFGTGYSSFAHLKRLPADYLKIDGSFIKKLVRNAVDQSVVRMIGEVARATGMETVGEYVQNAATLKLLGQYGIDYAQGFHVGRPAATPGRAAAAECSSA